MIWVQRLHQRLGVPVVHEFVSDTGAMAHDDKNPRTQDLQAVVRALPDARARRALLARADDALVHSDVIMKDTEYITRIA